MPLAVSSFRPMLSTVSIMPGMENLAPERQETSSGLAGSPNFLPVCFLDGLERLQLLLPHALGELLAGRQVGVAGLGGDGEAGRHRHADARHLGQVGALAAQQGCGRRPSLPAYCFCFLNLAERGRPIFLT